MYPVFVFSNILIGITLSLLIGRAAIWFAPKLGLMDIPGILPHKKHAYPTPLVGGITLVLALLLGMVFNSHLLPKLYALFLPALVIFGVGLLDDFRRLSAGIKLLGQIVATLLMIVLGISVRMVKPEIFGIGVTTAQLVNWSITLLWMIGITNAMNLIDSMDGLVVGLSGVAIAFLILVTQGSPQDTLLRLLTLLMGISIGLYYFNTSPARLFLGDSGAQTFGFLLAAIAILYTPTNYPQGSSWFLPILILGVPIFDTCLVSFSRIRRKQPIYRAGNDHTYHRLVTLGLDNRRAVAVMHIAAIVLGCCAFIALNLAPLYANILFGIVLIIGLVIFIFLDKKHS
jgi:UDP-GlcNAc:undecaprenyl-phosphate/decaprenyl-phosphate GlcNAc-1-phosphate transferase